MSQSVEVFSKMEAEVDRIAVSLVEMGGDLEDKAALVDLLEQVDALLEESRASDSYVLADVAEWWKKVLMAALLGQIKDADTASDLLNSFSEQASLQVRSYARGMDEEEIDMSGLIKRAADCLGVEYPGPFESVKREPESKSPEPEKSTEDSDNKLNEMLQDLDQKVSGVHEEVSREDTEMTFSDEGAPVDEDAPMDEEVPVDEETPGQPEEEIPSMAVDASEYAPEVLDYSDAMFEESLIYDFIDECESHLDDIEANLLTLENEPENIDLVDEIFRPIHSIKGSAGFLGVKVLQDFAHETENLLDEVRKGRIPVTSALTGTTIEASDILKTMLSQLRTAANRALGSDPSNEPHSPLPVKRVLACIEALLKGADIPEIPSGSSNPDGAASDEEPKLGEILVSDGAITQDELGEALDKQERPIGQVLVEEGLVSEDKVADALKKQGTSGKQPRGSIKVDVEKLDLLVNLVGELVITQTLVQGRSSLNAANGNGNGAGEALGKDIVQLGKITKEMQDQVMSLRMVPLRSVFQKMNRVIRDVSKKAGGKKVTLVTAGEDTEVDKTVSEIISDPLVHIIRNSADHGIELPDERRAAGKDETGKVQLSAYHEGGNIVIEITDDGKGLNREKILQKAIERGLAELGEKLTDSQIYNFVMAPGFSTAEKVTDISGRGVGLDVVKKNIEQLRGKVDIQSKEGVGTTLTIKLPLTLAIIDGMVVRVGKDKYILPTLSIVRSFRPSKEELSTVHGSGEMLNVRGELMPLVRLYHLYDARPTSTDPTEGLAVIVENEGKHYALLVDELLNQQQVVIKSLGSCFEGLKGVAGGTILGDGSVGLILDMGGVFEAYKDPYYRPFGLDMKKITEKVNSNTTPLEDYNHQDREG
jgi:two-component system chemotaxis sensor kinase CheA